MATNLLQAEVRTSGDLHIIELQGDIDREADAALSAAYERAAAGGGKILFNFSGVSYINSTGIALIVGLLAQAQAAGIEIRATGLSDHYREIFEITRLADFMSIFPDEAAARA